MLERGQFREDGGFLEGAYQPLARNTMGREPGDVLAEELDAPTGGAHEASQHVEKCALARAIGADDRKNFPGRIRQRKGDGVIGAAARAVAPPGTVITAVSPSMGFASIEGHHDEALSVPEVLEEVQKGEREGL